MTHGQNDETHGTRNSLPSESFKSEKEKAMFSIFNALRSFMLDRSYRALFIATLTIITIGSGFYHYAEGWRLIDSIYFSVITLTTVGYGDLSPQTDLGKIFTICYVLTGIGIVFGFINTFYRRGVERFKERQNKN